MKQWKENLTGRISLIDFDKMYASYYIGQSRVSEFLYTVEERYYCTYDRPDWTTIISGLTKKEAEYILEKFPEITKWNKDIFNENGKEND